MNERRKFIKKSLLGTAGLAIGGMGFSARSYNAVRGANDRISIAVVGIRNRGLAHISSWCKLRNTHNVQIKTLCDTDEQFFGPASKEVMAKGGKQPGTEWDIQKVLEDKDIDAVSLAIPNHWHALATIWACQAGKHVYVEKPACHNVWEGRKMIEAAKKYDRRVQVGFQNRSFSSVMQAMKFLHDGNIGDVYMARGLCIKPRDSFGIAEDGMPPSTLHYDRWLGPAPYRPYNEKRVHYNWHWFWDTGNGDTGNQGPHQFDIARWGLNKKNEHPSTIAAEGGLYGVDPHTCAQETPNTQSCLFKYHDGKMLEFATRGRYSNTESDLDIQVGNIFYGTEGYLEINGEAWKAFRRREKEPFATSAQQESRKNDITSLSGADDTVHYINFLEAMHTGKDDVLHCDTTEGFYSSALPLLANISYRLGGRQLSFSNGLEQFIGDSEADRLLTRVYRPPYVVPEQV